jgi:hypothetical protein
LIRHFFTTDLLVFKNENHIADQSGLVLPMNRDVYPDLAYLVNPPEALDAIKKFITSNLFQLRILRLCCHQDGYVRVCVFPQREEYLIRCAGFGGVVLYNVSASEAEAG